MKKLTTVLFVVTMLAGCAAKLEKIPLQETHSYDKDTKFAIKEEGDGFFLTMDYVRSRRFLEFDAAYSKACKSQLTSIARELSDKTGRKIKPVNEESIKVSMNDDTSCHAQVKVEWE